MKTDYNAEKEWWEAKAMSEVEDMADEYINRALRWMEIERHLPGISSIAEIGGASGAFSIPLARKAFDVTHIDFSENALSIAKERAQGIHNIRFVQANAVDLSQFPDRSFDMVLNMDGAVSFCGSDAPIAVKESCRICRKKIIFTVSHQGWLIPVWIRETLPRFGFIVPAARSMFDNGYWHYKEHEQNREIVEKYFGTLQAFTPSSLSSLISGCGFEVLRCTGIGSLANLCGPTVWDALKGKPGLMKEFLELCERFDKDIMPDGPGTQQRAGLILIGQRQLISGV